MMGRNLHRLGATVAMLALLFAQLSLAAYACPLPIGVAPHAPAAAMHADCAGHDAARVESALCELHCLVSVSVPSSPAADVGAVSMVPLTVDGPRAPSLAVPRLAQRIAFARMATAPPVAIRYCRLLI